MLLRMRCIIEMYYNMYFMSETEEQTIKKTRKLVKLSKFPILLDATRIAGKQNTFQRLTTGDLANKKPVYHADCIARRL